MDVQSGKKLETPMKVCIMCGGEGTRLRPLTFDRPKPAIPILNKPSVAHLVEHLAREGFNDIVITLGYLGGEIEQALGDGKVYGVHIDYVREHTKLGTAGSVKNAEQLLGGEPFIVVGGDHVMDVNLREIYRHHAGNSTKVTIGLLPIDEPGEYGIADMDVNNIIHRFLEKPAKGQIFSNLASTGIYVCDPSILDHIPAGKPFDFAKDLFPALLKKNETLKGFLVRGHWTDIGNPTAYRQASKWMLEKLPGTLITGHFNVKNAWVSGPIQVSHDVSLGSNSSLVGPIVIGENTTIGSNVLIGPYTAIGANCVIKDNARVFSSYIFNDVHIGHSTSVSGAIIDNDTNIGKRCMLETGTVIGPRVVIHDGVTVHSGVRMWPEVIVNKNEVIEEDLINEQYGQVAAGS